MYTNAADVARFMANVRVPLDPAACWEWTAGKHARGYGRIRWGGEAENAHRVSWMIHRGEIPAGRVVVQTCKNLACCNPAHLVLDEDRRARCPLPENREGGSVVARLRRQIAQLQTENNRLKIQVAQLEKGNLIW